MNFSDNVNLIVKTPVRELSDVQGYCVQALAEEWGKSQSECENAHWRSVKKLVTWFEDKFDDVKNLAYGSKKWRLLNSYMSEDLRNADPYGMTPIMMRDL